MWTIMNLKWTAITFGVTYITGGIAFVKFLEAYQEAKAAGVIA